jgi:chromosome segregation protein
VKLAYLELCGFRGYRKYMRIDFSDRFTIVDGRNGVGKSTIFDAVEFALTGTIGKYGNAKAAGESITDYLWWLGDGPAPKDHFVEVGFRDSDGEISIRRTQLGRTDSARLASISEKLCDPSFAPDEPLHQLCSTVIIRDEHIASLSLDLKETDRYAVLRDALGANDADTWIARAAQLVALAKRRLAAVQQEVMAVNTEIGVTSRRMDEVRAGLVAEATIAAAVERLRTFASTQVDPDRLAGPVRERIAAITAEIAVLQDLTARWSAVGSERLRIDTLKRSLEIANREREAALADLEGMSTEVVSTSASALAAQARNIIELVRLGGTIGLQDGHCPLCGKGQSHIEFVHGMAAAQEIARHLDEEAAREAEREQRRQVAELRLADAERAAKAAAVAHLTAVGIVESFDREMQEQGFGRDGSLEQISERQAELRETLSSAQRDLRILETLRFSDALDRAQRAEAGAKDRLARTQERFSRALKADATARALHDAARRAAGETLDRRLDRVLPLMSELYRRLRPHAIWRDIEYSIRGDVKRFLKLQVGEELNPQFLFSSGQRRATGLAFLLSVNLSLAWSRWRSILLDDPVQHVDDFRAVHLAEVMAQLVSEGRQVICAVEDAALADLLCRRLPIEKPNDAKRVTLGPDEDGALGKLREDQLTPLLRQSLLAMGEQSAAS